MKKILFSKEFPYLLTIIFISLGWTTKHFVNRFIDSPIIEWSFKENNAQGKYTIQNISRKLLYQDLTFSFHSGTSSISKISVKKIPPAANITAVHPKDSDLDTNTNKIEVEIDSFHPQCMFIIYLTINGKKYPKLNVISNKQAINLMRCSPITFIIKYEIYILLIFISVWIICILIYFHYILKYISKHQAYKKA